MIIEEAKYKECSECGMLHKVKNEVRGCDVCKGALDPHGLFVSVFYNDEKEGLPDHRSYKDYEYCSWDCLLKDIPNWDLEQAEFLSLPDVSFESSVPCKQRWQAFLSILCRCESCP